MSILSARDPKTILNDFLSQDDAAKIFRDETGYLGYLPAFGRIPPQLQYDGSQMQPLESKWFRSRNSWKDYLYAPFFSFWEIRPVGHDDL